MEAHILFVDDKEIKLDICRKEITKQLESILPSEAIHFYPAYDYHQAVEEFNKNTINLVITDRMMPGKDDRGMGGDDLVNYLRNELNSLVPIIVISAKSDANIPNEQLEFEKRGIQYIQRGSAFESDSKALAGKAYHIFNTEKALFGELNYKELYLDLNTSTISCNGKKETVTPYSGIVLKELILKKTQGTGLNYKEIFNALPHGEDEICDTDNIQKIVSNLRQSLKKIGTQVCVRSIRKTGYVLDTED